MAVFERRYLKKEFHPARQWPQRWGLHRGSHGSLRLAHLNPISVATPRETNRYRLEKIGMTGQRSFKQDRSSILFCGVKAIINYVRLESNLRGISAKAPDRSYG
ncbi:MAG TPA: hypothetical protein VMW89_02905 [Desulfatiglandales bacterium]|nr:hypothetical protein [Desulfatiglandales bacterium]